MPALKPTDYFATVLWLGSVKDSEADLRSDPTTDMPLTFAGYAAEKVMQG